MTQNGFKINILTDSDQMKFHVLIKCLKSAWKMRNNV